MTIIIKTKNKQRFTFWNVESFSIYAEITIIKHSDRPEQQFPTENISEIKVK